MAVVKDILTKDFVKVDVNETISKMIGQFKKAKKYYGLAFDKNKYIGFIGKRFLLTGRIDTTTMKVKNILKKRSKSKTPFFVPILNPETSINEACRLIATADVKALPVMDKNKNIIGVIDSIDLAKYIKKEYKNIPCEDIASMKLIKANNKDPFDKIINIMKKKNIDHIPVIDDEGDLFGIVSMGDVIEEFHISELFSSQKISRGLSHLPGKRGFSDRGEKNRVLGLPVENFTEKDVCTIDPDKDVLTAMNKMISCNKTSVVISEEKKPIGILTLRDIFLDFVKS